jgi:hypothetical protein
MTSAFRSQHMKHSTASLASSSTAAGVRRMNLCQIRNTMNAYAKDRMPTVTMHTRLTKKDGSMFFFVFLGAYEFGPRLKVLVDGVF